VKRGLDADVPPEARDGPRKVVQLVRAAGLKVEEKAGHRVRGARIDEGEGLLHVFRSNGDAAGPRYGEDFLDRAEKRSRP